MSALALKANSVNSMRLFWGNPIVFPHNVTHGVISELVKRHL